MSTDRGPLKAGQRCPQCAGNVLIRDRGDAVLTCNMCGFRDGPPLAPATKPRAPAETAVPTAREPEPMAPASPEPVPPPHATLITKREPTSIVRSRIEGLAMGELLRFRNDYRASVREGSDPSSPSHWTAEDSWTDIFYDRGMPESVTDTLAGWEAELMRTTDSPERRGALYALRSIRWWLEGMMAEDPDTGRPQHNPRGNLRNGTSVRVRMCSTRQDRYKISIWIFLRYAKDEDIAIICRRDEYSTAQTEQRPAMGIAVYIGDILPWRRAPDEKREED